jgi:hypothetical protein
MKNVTLFFMLLTFLSNFAWAGNKAAVVKLIRGEAFVHTGNQKTKLKVNDWIDSGTTIQTSAKSFLKIVFIDKSQMNIGASSEVKVEKFHSKDAGVIDLVRGKIRSQVTKDYLQIDGKNKSKLFIKTPNAVMGIRGTDFLITTTGKNTAAILFEGSVVFNRLDDRKLTDSAKLDDIVDQGVRMFPGEFSAVGEKGAPTIPALLNVQQKIKLESNKSFVKNTKSIVSKRSIVPEGLSRKTVSSKPTIDSKKGSADGRASNNPNSFVKNGKVKPMNGSFVLVDTAQIVQPGNGAIFDEASNTYVASNEVGELKEDGTFVVSNDVKIQSDTTIVSLDTSRDIDTGVKIDPTVIDPGTVIGSSTGPKVETAASGAQTTRIGETLNDISTKIPVVGPAAGATTNTVNETVNETTDTATGTINSAVGGAGRLIRR